MLVLKPLYECVGRGGTLKLDAEQATEAEALVGDALHQPMVRVAGQAGVGHLGGGGKGVVYAGWLGAGQGKSPEWAR